MYLHNNIPYFMNISYTTEVMSTITSINLLMHVFIFWLISDHQDMFYHYKCQIIYILNNIFYHNYLYIFLYILYFFYMTSILTSHLWYLLFIIYYHKNIMCWCLLRLILALKHHIFMVIHCSKISIRWNYIDYRHRNHHYSLLNLFSRYHRQNWE